MNSLIKIRLLLVSMSKIKDDELFLEILSREIKKLNECGFYR